MNIIETTQPTLPLHAFALAAAAFGGMAPKAMLDLLEGRAVAPGFDVDSLEDLANGASWLACERERDRGHVTGVSPAAIDYADEWLVDGAWVAFPSDGETPSRSTLSYGSGRTKVNLVVPDTDVEPELQFGYRDRELAYTTEELGEIKASIETRIAAASEPMRRLAY